MSIHLRRVRFTIRTKNEMWAGTNSTVRLWFEIDESHVTGDYEPGLHSFTLDHSMHDDFQKGATDSYEFPLGTDSSGRTVDGVAIPSGVQFSGFDELRDWPLHLEIGGGDRWVFDRYLFEVDVKEMKKVDGKYEITDWGWLQLAKHSGDIAMSTDEGEGVAVYDIPINGKLDA